MNCSPSGSSVHRIFLARILEWVVIPLPGDLPDPGIELTLPASPALAGRFFTSEPPEKPQGEWRPLPYYSLEKPGGCVLSSCNLEIYMVPSPSVWVVWPVSASASKSGYQILLFSWKRTRDYSWVTPAPHPSSNGSQVTSPPHLSHV